MIFSYFFEKDENMYPVPGYQKYIKSNDKVHESGQVFLKKLTVPKMSLASLFLCYKCLLALSFKSSKGTHCN